jgi:hypothetical protein
MVGAENELDHVVVLVVEAKGRVVNFNGDDLTGIMQADLHTLADDLGAPGQDTVALHPGGTSLKIGTGSGRGRLEADALAEGQGQ